MGNTFGRAFRVTTWGESHGDAVGAVIDGCPPRLTIDLAEIQRDLDRRRPGQSSLTTQRGEADQAQILSGVFDGLTLGTPIMIAVWNEDARGRDYEHLRHTYRPSHGDYTYQAKYGIRNWKGGGRASARETIGRVAAGAVARKLLETANGVEVLGYVKRVADLEGQVDPDTVALADVEATPVRCPDPAVAAVMIASIEQARKDGDSLGGVVEVVARNVPVGLGEPVFGKLEADLAAAMLSIPACKGFEIGSGLAGTRQTGSEHNDLFYNDAGRVRTRTNNSGGVQGGISNGENIVLRAAFKPTATIMRDQATVDDQGNEVVLQGRGRHDPCVLPRAVPIVEAMLALVLADHLLRQRGQVGDTG
ncbi:MAG: chorismate synthase [Chloroflexota bacterium]|jgi:chorismate synthase|nr:chorismate synthase [Chloroflexota bacterium]MDP6509015.1 chorismate synthase [Chloroflexota bacterium]MDP6758530.1 chorismate synthase [Chloroflexota bacterium]